MQEGHVSADQLTIVQLHTVIKCLQKNWFLSDCYRLLTFTTLSRAFCRGVEEVYVGTVGCALVY
jgi:stress response protein SCP2